MIVAKMCPAIFSAPSLLPVIILIPLILPEKEKHEIREICQEYRTLLGHSFGPEIVVLLYPFAPCSEKAEHDFG